MPIEIDQTPSSLLERIYSKIKRTIRDRKREHLRKKFALSLPCLAPANNKEFSVHMLICKKDLYMGICSIKSIALSAQDFYDITFHDDGSLGRTEYELLRAHFPGCVIITYDQSLQKAKEVFGEESIIYKYRLKGVMLLKLLDIKLFSRYQKVILLDSDILFFKFPQALIHSALDLNAPNCFNRDIDTAYMMDKTYLESITGYPLPERLNAGLSVIHIDVIDFEKISIWLDTMEKSNQPFVMHRIEQTLMAMLIGGSKKGFAFLPEGYDVSLHKEVKDSICKHYVGIIRHGFELEGLIYLMDELKFLKNWNSFLKTRGAS